MKKLILTIIVVIAFQSLSAQETQPAYKWIFKMSPQHLAQNILKVGGEVFNESRSRSFQVFVQAVANNKGDYCCGNFGYNGMGTELNVRKYPLPLQTMTNRKGRQFTQGIYFSGFLQGGVYEGDSDGFEFVYDPQTNTSTRTPYQYSVKIKNIATGFTIGLQRVFWKVLSLDVYVGAGYQASEEKVDGNRPDWYDYPVTTGPNYYGILPKVGLYLGMTM